MPLVVTCEKKKKKVEMGPMHSSLLFLSLSKFYIKKIAVLFPPLQLTHQNNTPYLITLPF